MKQKILDAACGSKMFWYDRNNEFAMYVDNRMLKLGKNSWMAKKYGKLPENWQEVIKHGFDECFRVLQPFGTLAFKWSSEQIPHAQVLKLAPELPLFGDRRGKTRWTFFVKGARNNG